MDTLRADRVGAYGYERPTTPRIDGLASRSIVFEKAISQSAWTRPAHASMFTGLYPSEHAIVAMDKQSRVAPELPVLAELISARGYVTAAFTGGANMSAHFGFARGFDVYESPGRRFIEHLPSVEGWLDGIESKPFFLFVHAFDAHRPYRSEPEDRRALGLPSERATGILHACRDGNGPEDLAAYTAEYDAAVRHGDRGVGALLDLLAERKLLDSTVIVFTSDHGEEFLEHGRCFHIRTLYKEVVDVPLVLSVPGLGPNRVAQSVAASVSVAPTVLDILFGDRSELPGPSLVPALSGGSLAPAPVVSETSSRYSNGRGVGHVRSLTRDGEKLVHWIAQGRYEYFDLRDDPFEKRPIAKHSRIAVLANELEAWAEAHPARVDARGEPISDELEDELRSMGYFQ